MKYVILITILIFATLLWGGCKNTTTGPDLTTNDLITNYSFENSSGHGSIDGWVLYDTNKVAYSYDVPLAGGSWSIAITPGITETPWARAYVTGESGSRIYKLTAWSKIANTSVPASITLGLLQAGSSTILHPKTRTVSVLDWTLYTIQDTIDIVSTDTLVVQLAPGTNPTNPPAEQAFFDLVRLERFQ